MSALGDAVHALALANGLRHGYPDAHITWIIQKLPYELVRNQSSVDRFIIFQRKGGAKAWMQLRRDLGEMHFDLVLVPQVSAKASIVAWLTRAEIKLGFDYKRSRELQWIVTNRKLPTGPARHVQDQYMEFLEYLGIQGYEPEWNFEFSQEELAWKEAFFQQFDRPVMSFVLASSKPDKDWDIQKYARVMDYASDTLNMQPVMVGGPSQREKGMVEAITRICRCRPFSGLEGPVRHTMLQLAGSRVVLAPDTGPLHTAVALNVPTISLYGYSNPRRCGPYRRFHDLLIDKYTDPGELDGPIGRKVKPGRMDLITVDEVIEKLQLALKNY